MNCLIVDDEPLSREVLRDYIAQVGELKVMAECLNAMDALSVLGKERIDLLFLDINMPGLSGIAMARSLNDPPMIIFTTAYPQFAVEGFELNALDYLVKPYSFERFMTAVNRAREKASQETPAPEAGKKIMVKADRKLYAIEAGDIRYVEGQGDYIRLHMEHQRLVVHDTIKSFMKVLPETDFMRVHKSFVVNLKSIEFIEGNQLRVGGESIPVSPGLKEEVLERYSAL